MKSNIIAFLLVLGTTLFSASFAQAQTTPPKKEYTITLAERQVTIFPGEEKEIEVEVLRSKSYRKTKINLETGSRLPEGLDITYKAPEGTSNTYTMVIKAGQDVKEGQLMLIVNAKSNRVTKGTMLKVNLESQKISSN